MASDRLSNVFRNIKKATGPVAGNAQSRTMPDRFISSGSLSMDRALGGGIRIGGILMLFGDKSGGKTTTAKRFVAKAQNSCRNCFRIAKHVEAVPPSKEDIEEFGEDARWSATGYCTCFAEGIYKPEEPKKESSEGKKVYEERLARWREEMTNNSYEELICMWIDLENSFHRGYATKLGIDCRRLFHVRPTNAEDAIDIAHAGSLSGQVDFMALDSIAQMTPQAEITESMQKWQQGLQARLVNKAARKIVQSVCDGENRKRPLTQIWINQIRESIAIVFGDKNVKPGGKGQDFAVQAEVRFRRGKVETIVEQYGGKEDTFKVPVIETFEFSVTKDRVSGKKGSDGFYMQSMRDTDTYKQGEIIETEYIFKLAMHYLVVVDKKKNTYTLGDRTFASQKELLGSMRDKEFVEVIKSVLLERMIGSNAPVSAKTAAASGEPEPEIVPPVADEVHEDIVASVAE